MKYFFSPETKGFYVEGVHSNMPEDVFEISIEEHRTLMEGQAAGKEIVYKNRKVRLADRVIEGPTWDSIREKRDRLLTKCDWTQIPDAQLTEEQREEWREYRQLLRSLPEAFAEPSQVIWPMAPSNEE